MPDRSVAPDFVTPVSCKIPPLEVETLDNGIKIHMLNSSVIPVLKIEFVFKSGIWYEKQAGQSFFTGKMLPEGTKRHTSEQIYEYLDQYGAFIDMVPGFDFMEFSIYVGRRNLPYVLPLIHEILNEPQFPEEELERLKNIQIQQLNVNKKKNSFVASRMFRNAIFGDSYPYGKIMDVEDIEKVDTSLLRDFFRSSVQDIFEVFVTGDITQEVKTQLFNIFGSTCCRNPTKPEYPLVTGAFFNKHISREDSVQTSIKMGRQIFKKNNPDYVKLLVLNEVFGGYFGSRLMQNIREDKGYTYGIFSSIISHRNAAYFIISTDVRKEYKDETILEIQKEIKRLKEEKIGSEELIYVKNYLKGSIVNAITNNFSQMDRYKALTLYDLPSGFYDDIFDQIDHTDGDLLLQFANEYLFRDEFNVITVG